jgi:ATP/maltotriose-dependent transcriptional regulator MalT
VQEKYSEDLVHLGLKTGEMYLTATHLGMQIQILLERGDREAEKLLDKLAEIGELYDYNYARLAHYTHGSLYLLKYMEFNKALVRADEGIAWIGKNMGNQPGLLMIYSLKIKSQVMLGDLDGAEETLRVAEDFAARQAHVPYFLSFFLTAGMLLHTRQLEEAMETRDRKKILLHKKYIAHHAKKTLRIARKVSFELIEVYRLHGIYYWLTGKQGKALRWWGRAIREAEKMGAKLELSLTLMEVSQRLAEPIRKHGEVDGNDPDALRQRAEQLYREMDIKIP